MVAGAVTPRGVLVRTANLSAGAALSFARSSHMTDLETLHTAGVAWCDERTFGVLCDVATKARAYIHALDASMGAELADLRGCLDAEGKTEKALRESLDALTQLEEVQGEQ